MEKMTFKEFYEKMNLSDKELALNLDLSISLINSMRHEKFKVSEKTKEIIKEKYNVEIIEVKKEFLLKDELKNEKEKIKELNCEIKKLNDEISKFNNDKEKVNQSVSYQKMLLKIIAKADLEFYSSVKNQILIKKLLNSFVENSVF